MTKLGLESRVLIVGGGIGGLTTALALARNGMRATVLERSLFGDETGAGIQLGPNATRALAKLGVLDAIAAIAFRPERLRLFDGVSGVSLATVPLGHGAERYYGAPYFTLHRADLHATLLAACQDQAAIGLQTGFDVTLVEPSGDAVIASRGDGTQVEGSSLIAADGLWSRLRQHLVPNADLRFSGATAWRALLPRDQAPTPFAASEVGLWLGPRAHLVHYPVRGGQDLNIVAVVEGGSAKEGWDRRADGDVLLACFDRWASPAKALIRAVQAWRCWSLFGLKPLPRWSDNRIALLGDAAHPVLPYLAQGAALAIEDAVTLAESLKASYGNPAVAFSRYQSLRKQRTARVQVEAGRLGRIYHLGGLAASARNAVLRLRSQEALLRRFAWLYGHKQT